MGLHKGLRLLLRGSQAEQLGLGHTHGDTSTYTSFPSFPKHTYIFNENFKITFHIPKKAVIFIAITLTL